MRKFEEVEQLKIENCAIFCSSYKIDVNGFRNIFKK